MGGYQVDKVNKSALNNTRKGLCERAVKLDQSLYNRKEQIIESNQQIQNMKAQLGDAGIAITIDNTRWNEFNQK